MHRTKQTATTTPKLDPVLCWLCLQDAKLVNDPWANGKHTLAPPPIRLTFNPFQPRLKILVQTFITAMLLSDSRYVNATSFLPSFNSLADAWPACLGLAFVAFVVDGFFQGFNNAPPHWWEAKQGAAEGEAEKANERGDAVGDWWGQVKLMGVAAVVSSRQFHQQYHVPDNFFSTIM